MESHCSKAAAVPQGIKIPVIAALQWLHIPSSIKSQTTSHLCSKRNFLANGVRAGISLTASEQLWLIIIIVVPFVILWQLWGDTRAQGPPAHRIQCLAVTGSLCWWLWKTWGLAQTPLRKAGFLSMSNPCLSARGKCQSKRLLVALMLEQQGKLWYYGKAANIGL